MERLESGHRNTGMTGENNAEPVSDFVPQVDQCARVSNWSGEDKANIIKGKITGSAWQFVKGRDDLPAEVPYEQLRVALIERIPDKLPARYYHTLLHEATQGKDESPAEFLDRYGVFSTKVTRIRANPVEQRVLRSRFSTSYQVHIRRQGQHR
jgi:hypothetical protein